MKLLNLIFIGIISGGFHIVQVSAQVPVEANETPIEFFQKIVNLARNFDNSAIQYYSDDAKIHAYRRYPHGLERSMEFTGTQWKQVMELVMPVAKTRNDRSSYSDVRVVKSGENYKIKATRYSELKCYTDTGYYLVIEPDGNGSFRVIEQYMETQPQSDC
ncbi:MAG: hypothetical protein KDF59_15605 [Nitrosomonas sp.]|nr:hypothetical protein [Nitrosomonas sp.]